MTEENQITPVDQHRSKVVRAFGTMPGWKRTLLGVSLLIGAIGAFGEVASYSHHKNAQPPSAETRSTSNPNAPSYVPPGSSGFAGKQPDTDSAPSTATPTNTTSTDQSPTATETVTPWMRRLGFSFFVGLVVGFLFRTFLKMATMLSLLVGGGFLALSYFGILNVDLTSVKSQYASSASWISDQAFRLKDVIFAALPSSTAAGAGFLSGFKRR